MAAYRASLNGVTKHPELSANPGLALRTPLLAWLAAILICFLVYLAFAVPGNWFPGAATKTWMPHELSIVKGTGGFAEGKLQLVEPDADGQTLVVAPGAFRARDFAAIDWEAIGAHADTNYRLVWRSDYAPQKLIAVPILVGSNRLAPVVVRDMDGWLGNITFLGLLVRGPLIEPLQIASVSAKPMGAFDTLRDRIREWLTYEKVSGTSINVIAGGNAVQDLPLPFLLGVAIALAAAGLWLIRRYRGVPTASVVAGSLAIMFIASWFVLDARWMWNLARQTGDNVSLYGGKDWRQKHLAADDGPLFAFIEKVRGQLPTEPARIFVAADAHFFRGRAAYHLYPHRVYFEASRNVLPAPNDLRRGDFMVVYQRRGVAYDAAAGLLRWDGGAPVKAKLKLVDQGAALFEIL